MGKNDPEVSERWQAYLDWIDAEIALVETNHNQKETMAWSATGAYLGIVVLAASGASYLRGWWQQGSATVVILVMWYATYVFVSIQFERRWKAADLWNALHRVKGELLHLGPGGFARLEPESWDVPTRRNPRMSEEDWIWPYFISGEIEACTTFPEPWCCILRNLIPWWRREHNDASKKAHCAAGCDCWFNRHPRLLPRPRLKEIGARRRSEIASYAVLLIATVISVGLVCIPEKKSKLTEALHENTKGLRDTVAAIAAHLQAVSNVATTQPGTTVPAPAAAGANGLGSVAPGTIVAPTQPSASKP